MILLGDMVQRKSPLAGWGPRGLPSFQFAVSLRGQGWVVLPSHLCGNVHCLKDSTQRGHCGQLTKADQQMAPLALPMTLSLDYIFLGQWKYYQHSSAGKCLGWPLSVPLLTADEGFPKSWDTRVKWVPLAESLLGFSTSFTLCTLSSFSRVPAFTPPHVWMWFPTHPL